MRSVLTACLLLIVVSVLATLTTNKENCVDALVSTLLCFTSVVALCILYTVHVPNLGRCCHMVFIVAISYGTLLACQPLLKLTIATVALTLVTRNVFGGCLFNMIEGDGCIQDGNKDDDIVLCGMLGIGLARAMFQKQGFSQLAKEVGLAAVALHTISRGTRSVV